MASKLTTSFIKITNVLERNGQPEIYKLYKSMLSEEELECLITTEMLRGFRKHSKKNNNSATEALPAKKRGRKKQVVEVVYSDTMAEEKPRKNQAKLPIANRKNLFKSLCRSYIYFFISGILYTLFY